MKTVKELYEFLNERIPRTLSCNWDNDGLMVSGELCLAYSKILLALDVTNSTVEYAVQNGYSIIISHHPMIFKPLKHLCEDEFTARKAIKLLKNGISVFSFHTRLDALCGGVNDALAEKLGLSNISLFVTEDEMIGRIGDLDEEITLSELVEKVKTQLSCDKLTYVEGKKKNKIKRVCLVGGDGKDFLKAAYYSKADAYITGSMSYNSMLDASDMEISVIEAGHFETENPVLDKLEELIREFDSEVSIGRYMSNPIKTV